MMLWLLGMIKLFSFLIVKVIFDRIQKSMGRLYIYPFMNTIENQPNLCKYTIYMDPMAIEMCFFGDGVVWQENERNKSRERKARFQQ